LQVRRPQAHAGRERGVREVQRPRELRLQQVRERLVRGIGISSSARETSRSSLRGQ
jgi:hypothetical protein